MLCCVVPVRRSRPKFLYSLRNIDGRHGHEFEIWSRSSSVRIPVPGAGETRHHMRASRPTGQRERVGPLRAAEEGVRFRRPLSPIPACKGRGSPGKQTALRFVAPISYPVLRLRGWGRRGDASVQEART